MFWKRPQAVAELKIPVEEGKQYRVGDITVEGATVFPAGFHRDVLQAPAGTGLQRVEDRHQGIESLRELYGSRGYVQFTGFLHQKAGRRVRRGRRDHQPQRGPAVLREPYRVQGKHHHPGQGDPPRDVAERAGRDEHGTAQDVHPPIDRLRATSSPSRNRRFEPVPETDNKLDVTLRLAEQNRNQFTFGGGVSGLEGAFINLAFSTTNFLGRGETASFALQTGSRTRNFQIALTDPYFMDLPITAGFDLFKRTLRLPQFTREDTGGSLIWGIPVKRFSRLFLNYNYSVIKTSEPDPDLVSLRTTSSPTRGTSIRGSTGSRGISPRAR